MGEQCLCDAKKRAQSELELPLQLHSSCKWTRRRLQAEGCARRTQASLKLIDVVANRGGRGGVAHMLHMLQATRERGGREARRQRFLD